MVIGFRTAPTATSGSSVSPAIIVPATVAVGDVLLVRMDCNLGAGTSITDPAPLTGIDSDLVTGALKSRNYYRVVQAGDASSTLTWTLSSAVRWSVTLEVYTGVDNTTPIHAHSKFVETGAGTSHVAPTVSVTTSGCWVHESIGDRASPGSSSFTPPAAITSRSFVAGSGGGSTSTGSGDTNTTVATGTRGGGTWTGTASTINAILFTVALAPAVSGFTGDAPVAASVAVTAAGVKGISTGAPVSVSVSVNAAGVKGSSTGAPVAPTVTVSATGGTGVTQDAPQAVSVAVTATGSVTTALSSGAPVAVSVAVTATGSTKATKGALTTATVTVTAAGGLRAPGPGGLPTITVELDDGSETFPYNITQYVDLEAGYTITHGRSDQFDAIEASTLTMTLNNTTGVFAAGTPTFDPEVDHAIRVTHTVAGVVSRRFTGYVQRWPVKWSDSGMDRLAFTNITAVDRLPRWSRQTLQSITVEEHLRRLAGASAPYWPLTDPAGSTQVASIEPQLPDQLAPAGTGAAVLFSGGTAPTYGGPSAALFSSGKYLRGTSVIFVADPVLTAFITTASTPSGTSTLIRYLDNGAGGRPVAALWLFIDSSGRLRGTYDDGLGGTVTVSSSAVVTDGLTHHVALRAAGTSLELYIDGLLDGTIAAGVVAISGYVYVGGDGLGNGYTGSISHVAMFDSATPVGATEIAALSASGLTGFAGERTDQRVARLLDRAGVPSGSMALETGAQTTPAADALEGVSIADAVVDVMTAENGLVFVAGDGTVIMQNRSHRAHRTTAAATLTAGDVGGDVEVLYDLDQGANYVTATRPDGTAQLAQNPGSITEHGTYPVDLGTLAVVTDAQALDAAWWRVNGFSEPSVRLPGVTVDLLTQPTAFQQTVQGLEVSDRVALTGIPSNAPTVDDQIVEGWTETVHVTATDVEWSMQFNTSSWSTEQVWILDDPVYSILDSTTRLGL